MGLQRERSRVLDYILLSFVVYIAILTHSSVAEVGDSCPDIFSCANCTAVRFCLPDGNNGFKEYDRYQCSGVNRFCNNSTGSCQDMPTPECAVIGEFICLQNGTFPHPTDCTKYYVCTNLVSHTYECTQSYYHYDSVTEKCTYTPCESFNCNGGNGVKAVYPTDSSIYGFCIKGEPLVVDKCSGRDELNVTSQECEPICRHEGTIPDTRNSSNYYKCSLADGNQLSMTKRQCPDGQVYYNDEFMCVTPPSSQ